MTAHSNGSRLLRGIGALLLLLGVIIGVPVALIILGGNPLPIAITWADLRDALFTPDDGTILLGLVTIIGWLAWAVFALSVIIELITVVSRHRIRIRLPGLAAPQRAAAGLLVAVAAMITTPTVVSTPPSAPAPPALILPASTPPAEPPPAAEPDAVPAGANWHRTRPGPRRTHRGRPVDPGRALLRAGNRLAPDRRGQPDGVDRRTGPAGGRLATGHSRRRRARQGQAHDHRTPWRHAVLDCRARARFSQPLARALSGQPKPAQRSGRPSDRDPAGHARGATGREARAPR